MTNQKEYLSSGEPARLVPVIAASRTEQRLSSIFLAVLVAIPKFTEQLLLPMGVKLGKHSKIETFTEVVLKNQRDNKDRPDGLLIISKGKREWRALLEVKSGKSELEVEQIKRYLKIARNNTRKKDFKFDAVITISNQFAARPEHSPVNVSGHLTRTVKLYHWSWKFIQTEAKLLDFQKVLEHPCESYLLKEFIRFLDDDPNCISKTMRMPYSWSELVSTLTKGGQINKSSLETEEVVATWYSVVGKLQLHFCQELSTSVLVKMPRVHINAPRKRLVDGCKLLAESGVLSAEFEIPDAASLLIVVVDVRNRTIRTSMTIDAPGKLKKGPSKVKWLLNQLEKTTQQESVYIRFIYERKVQTSKYSYSLKELNSSDDQALQNKLPQIPIRFEMFSLYEDGRKFSGVETFVKALEQTVTEYYRNVGMYLRR